ncbi:MAG: macro domain-containing protein [Clostridiales bacterium]|jgi:O-acetyl-ADP-ribose deacetylase (regulator of RNase III)|nr:macro domain-containing protein [Clostridiales bacterium]
MVFLIVFGSLGGVLFFTLGIFIFRKFRKKDSMQEQNEENKTVKADENEDEDIREILPNSEDKYEINERIPSRLPETLTPLGEKPSEVPSSNEKPSEIPAKIPSPSEKPSEEPNSNVKFFERFLLDGGEKIALAVVDGSAVDSLRGEQMKGTQVESLLTVLEQNFGSKELVFATLNAANSSLRSGGGICGVIFGSVKDSPGLAKECSDLGGCPVGSAKITGSYGLPGFSYVAHGVSPQKGDADIEEKLTNAYHEALVLVNEKKVKAFNACCLGIGIFGIPILISVKCFYKALSDYFSKVQSGEISPNHLALVVMSCYTGPGGNKESLPAFTEGARDFQTMYEAIIQHHQAPPSGL